MPDYIIDIIQIETLQMTSDLEGLDKIFERAKSTIIQGQNVILARKQHKGKLETFDVLTTETDLSEFKSKVYKYL